MFIPFNFNSMLDYLCRLARREKMYDEIRDGNFEPESCRNDASNFIKLFQSGVEEVDGTSDRQV